MGMGLAAGNEFGRGLESEREKKKNFLGSVFLGRICRCTPSACIYSSPITPILP